MSTETARLAFARSHNRTAGPQPPDGLIHEVFAEQVRATPDAVALDWTDGVMTYRDLHRRAAGLAAVLTDKGVGPESIVPLVVERSAPGIVGILAVLMAGAAYSPLDPGEPPTRLRSMIARLGATVVLASAGTAAPFGDGIEVLDPTDHVRDRSPARIRVPGVNAGDPAYVIHTSGTTGEPKAVVCSHRGAVRLVRDATWLRIRSGDVLLATTNLTFDVSCFEVFGALLNGARLVLPETESLLSPSDLERLILGKGVTVAFFSAGLLHQTVAARPDMFRTLRCLLGGGSALHPDRVRAVLAHGRPGLFLNGYGPTENAVFSTVHRLDSLDPDAESVPIGRPVSNSTAWVVRDDGTLAAPGERGELWVGGAGVALGYHGRPDLTRERFVPDPFGDSRRLYRTGDVARWRPDGVIEFFGRLDRQVKVRGFRVELLEIETVLGTHPRVVEAAVALDPDGGDRLIAGVAATPPKPSPGQLRVFLRDRLPGFMVPSRFAVLDELPFNNSGKVVFERFPESAEDTPADPPRGRVESAVAKVWTALLGLDEIGRDDDFLSLGGQSLQATQVAAGIREYLPVRPESGRRLIASLLANPTVAAFAADVERVLSDASIASAAKQVDFAAEAALDPALSFDAPADGNPLRPRSVLLTGGTGFLGVFLLDRLVRAGVDRVHCLGRAGDPTALRRRIEARMRRYGLDPALVAEHVVAVPGDLSLPRFGLGATAADTLATDVDVIVHNGSRVNFAYPYQALRAPNVDGTCEVLRLAATDHLKPVHYISSIAVIAGYGTAGVRRVREGTPLAYPERISLGYPETKWVAEKLVHEAGGRGLPVAVYRPYEITGTRDEGKWNTDTMMCALFRTIAETGIAPDIELPLDFVPVDYTAEAIVHLITHQRPDGRVYHVTNPEDARLGLLVDRLRAMGYVIESLPYATWCRRMADHTARHPESPMAPYMPMFLEGASDAEISVKEMYFAGTFPEFDRTNLERGTAGAGLDLPPVDAALIDLYLRNFVDSGFLTP